MYQEPVLYLLKAEQLPQNRIEIQQFTNGDLRSALALISRLELDDPDIEALALVGQALDLIPLDATPTTYTQQEKAALPFDRYEEHDEFFRVVRVSGDRMSIFIRSILQLYYSLLEESIAAGVTLDIHDWKILRSSFEFLLHYLREAAGDDGEIPMPLLVMPTVISRELHPLRRWRLGHQAFFTIIQGLIVLLNCFYSSHASGNVQDAGATLGLATHLMWGTASALRLAGDFRTEGYEGIVRPAMMPPHLEPGFSGLQVRDHRYLLKILKELKPVFVELDEQLRHQHDQFSQAVEAAYEAHKYVCANFRGNEEPSLRMSANSKASAVDVLDQLKHSRIRIVKP